MSSERKPIWIDFDNGVVGTFVTKKTTGITGEVKPVIYPQGSNWFSILFGKTFVYPEPVKDDNIFRVALPDLENYKGIETDLVIHASGNHTGLLKVLNISVLKELEASRKREETERMENTRLVQKVMANAQGEAKDKANKNALDGRKENPFFAPRNDFGFNR